jgi:hypothetical protein
MLQSGQVSLYIPLRWHFEDVVGCGGLEKCLDMELLVLKATPSFKFFEDAGEAVDFFPCVREGDPFSFFYLVVFGCLWFLDGFVN